MRLNGLALLLNRFGAGQFMRKVLGYILANDQKRYFSTLEKTVSRMNVVEWTPDVMGGLVFSSIEQVNDVVSTIKVRRGLTTFKVIFFGGFFKLKPVFCFNGEKINRNNITFFIRSGFGAG